MSSGPGRPTAHLHRDDWRVKIAVITGKDIPAPAYVPDKLMGLPMESANQDPEPAELNKKRYWKISAGRGSSEWPLFRDASVIAMNWYDEYFDPSDLPNDRDDFIRRLRGEVPDLSVPGAASIWDFRSEVSIGDEVIVYSEYEVLGEGSVTSDYYYDISTGNFRHRRRVDWNSTDPVSTKHLGNELQSKLSRRQTLIELERQEFQEVMGRETQDRGRVTGQAELRVGATLNSGFKSAGLNYTSSQVASFYTALQTKGFVILSGISGTGKSKIAQRFSEMLPDIAAQPKPSLAEDFVQVTVRPYMKKYKRIRLLNEVSGGLPVPEPGTSVTVPLNIDGQEGTCRVWNRPGTNADTYIFMQGELGEVFRKTHGEHFALRFHVDEAEDRLTAIEMRTELPTEPVPDISMVSMSNHLFLPVRPDWRDGKALIGYHNPLSGEYVRTDFLDFVISAADDYAVGNRNAFFVILDEMNLAHVEYYFADVLSVIESGRDAEGWTVEGIPLAVGEEDANLPESLRLPPNLYIVGTVNMDETTHPFSPKVLDRAFTIELTEVDFTDYPPEQVETSDVDEAEKQALLEAFTQGGRYPRIDKAEIAAFVADHEKYRDALQSLNASLRRSRMHFGYRVFDEIMQFAYNAEENGLFTIDEAFDHAVLMKVLPKFNGSRGKLQNALFELIHWCRMEGTLTQSYRSNLESRFASLIDQGQPFDQIVKTGEDSVEDNWRYPATGKRAALMMQDLYTDGFTSFG